MAYNAFIEHEPELKGFLITETDTVIAKTREQAIEWYNKEYSDTEWTLDENDIEEIDQTTPYTIFDFEHDSQTSETKTLAEWIAALPENQEIPFILSSTEYQG